MIMKRFLAATALAIAGLLIPAAASAERLPGSAHGGAPLTATLAPSVSGSNGTGSAMVTVNPGQGEICNVVSVANLTGAVIAAHIHSGPAGTNGPVVFPFNPSLGRGPHRSDQGEDQRDYRRIRPYVRWRRRPGLFARQQAVGLIEAHGIGAKSMSATATEKRSTL